MSSNLLSYFSFKGRISKNEMVRNLRDLIFSLLKIGVLVFIFIVFISVVFDAFDYAFSAFSIFLVCIFWRLASIFVRRGHDRNRSGLPVFLALTWIIISSIFTVIFSFESELLGLVEMGSLLGICFYLIPHIVDCFEEGAVNGAEQFGDTTI